MPDLDALNPYPEDEPQLRQAWEDGYRAAQEGRQATESPDLPDRIVQAFRLGYDAALIRGEED